MDPMEKHNVFLDPFQDVIIILLSERFFCVFRLSKATSHKLSTSGKELPLLRKTINQSFICDGKNGTP